MKNNDLVKDSKKLYWDEENKVYMQYSPISDMFLVKKPYAHLKKSPLYFY